MEIVERCKLETVVQIGSDIVHSVRPALLSKMCLVHRSGACFDQEIVADALPESPEVCMHFVTAVPDPGAVAIHVAVVVDEVDFVVVADAGAGAGDGAGVVGFDFGVGVVAVGEHGDADGDGGEEEGAVVVAAVVVDERSDPAAYSIAEEDLEAHFGMRAD